MTYNDITYCSRECANMECKRNQKHLPQGAKIVSMAEFKDCENWREIDADFMFKELDFSKGEDTGFITYRNKEKDEIVFCKNKKTFFCADDFEVAREISVQELKAINKKCQELGWE